jgi:methionyl-tRNA formyltransferase
MRLAFLGTPEAAVPTLRALVESGHDVAIVITRPDRKRGRGSQLSPSPVKACAQELGLSVGHRLSDLDDVGVERGVVVAYGRLIPGELLERIPMLNVHFSLLPRWRGAAPVERAILAGDDETGVSVMTLDVALDTGPVHLERRVRVDDKSLSSLLGELATVGADALVEVLDSPALLADAKSQIGEPTYAAKLSKEDYHLTPSLTREQILRIVRLGKAFTFVDGRRLLVVAAEMDVQVFMDGPEPGTRVHVTPGSIMIRHFLVVLATSDGTISLQRVRPEGAKSMDAMAWWVGARLDPLSARWA